ncbi:hypothetical protein ACLBXM_20800 [Xanthobacteraceae bacterium A53D]
MRAMSRTLTAFLIAPLWIPLLLAVGAAIDPPRTPGLVMSAGEAAWRAGVVGAVGAYAVSWTIGVALHFMLKALEWRAPLVHALVWFLTGMLLRACGLAGAWMVSFGAGFAFNQLTSALVGRPGFFIAGGLMFALVGLTLRFLLPKD